MKRRVGYLFGKPIVQGDENLVDNYELLAKKTQSSVEIYKRNDIGDLENINKASGSVEEISSGKYYIYHGTAIGPSYPKTVKSLVAVIDPSTYKGEAIKIKHSTNDSGNYVVNHELQIGDTLDTEEIFTKYPNINEYGKVVITQNQGEGKGFNAQVALTPACIQTSFIEIEDGEFVATKLNISDISKSIYLKFEEE